MRAPTAPEQILARLISDRLRPNEIQDSQWPDIVEAALQHNLGPFLFRQIQAVAGQERAFEPLRRNARIAAMTFMTQDAARQEIDAALRSAAIPCVWVKGSVLAHAVYPAPELRPMGDLDVLVPFEHFEQAKNALLDLGYRPPDKEILVFPAEFAARDDHHLVLQGGAGGQIMVELHWRLLNPMLLDDDQMAGLWQQTLEVESGGQTMTTLQPEAHLLYLCAHALLQHGEAAIRLVHYLDLHLLVSHYPMDWARIIERAIALQWTYTVERALQTTADTFDTPIPPHVFEELRRKRPADEAAQQVDALAGAGQRFEQVFRLMQGESISVQARLIVAIALPTRSYMRARYAVPPDQPLWPWYLRRWANQGLEVWKALRARGQSWL